MKKSIYSILVFAAVVLVACAKEQDIVTEKPEIPATEEPQEATTSSAIPLTITASLDDSILSKTSYDSDGKFTWGENDQIAVYYYLTYGESHYQTWLAYQVSERSNGNKTATFSVVDGQDSKTKAISDYGFETNGMAVYPVSIARPSTGNYEQTSYSGGIPFVTLKGTASTSMTNNVPITGIETAGVYMFSSAESVMTVTLNNVPAEATTAKLVTSDKANCPLAGDFHLSLTDGVYAYTFGTGGTYESYWNNDFSDNLSTAITANGSTPITLYFNVPVGTYPARTLSVDLYNSDGNRIDSKVIKKELTTVRNELLEIPAITLDTWTDVGTGKFIDNFLWAKLVAKGLDKDTPDYVNVTIQRSNQNAKKYRLVDPYGAMRTAFSYTPSVTKARDLYLYFTLNGSNVSTFGTHITGTNIDGYNNNPELVYPTVYDGEYDASLNKILAGTDTDPQIVQLAPVYRYNDNKSSAYNYTDHHMDRNGVFRIIFPGVTGYDGTLSPATGATAATLSPLAFTHGANAGKIRMIISEFPDYSIAAPSINSYYCGNYPDGNDASTDASNASWDASAKVTARAIPTGTAYLTWYTTNADETAIYDQGRTKVYYISGDDVAAVCSRYGRDLTIGSTSSLVGHLDCSGDNTITIATSNDPTKGNVMITEFCGMTNDVSENTFTTYDYDFTQFSDGDPVYGVYGEENTVDGKAGAIFSDLTNQVFYTDAGKSKHIIGTEDASLSYLSFAFNSTYWDSPVAHDLVVYNEKIGNNWGQSLVNNDFYFTSYTAFKTKGMINLTASMLKTKSSYGEGGTGDSGGKAALVNKTPGIQGQSGHSWWHTNWAGSVDSDEQGAWVQIDLTSLSKTVNNFTIKFLTRGNITHGLPTKYRIAVSNNENSGWTFVDGGETTIAASSGDEGTWFQKTVSAGGEYSYVRLCITASDRGPLTTTIDGTYYVHLAELQLWEN